MMKGVDAKVSREGKRRVVSVLVMSSKTVSGNDVAVHLSVRVSCSQVSGKRDQIGLKGECLSGRRTVANS